MQTAQLLLRPDGTIVGLHTELIELAQLGKLQIHRATNIEFCNRLQAWRVYDLDRFPMFTAPTRQICLDWEKDYLNAALTEGEVV